MTTFFRAPFALVPILTCACSMGGDDDGGISSGECSGLLAGDLVITEVMANPAGEDRGNEYFEIYNAGMATADLTGLTLAYSLVDAPAEEETHEVGELSIAAGEYKVVGTADPEELPDFIDYGFGNDLGSLRNAGAVLALRCGDVEVDRTEYPSAEGDDGVSWGLDGSATPDYLANDTVANFCPATMSFAPDMFGSPGEPNEPCHPVAAGTCTDGGAERDVVVPAVGDLVISEYMASPADADATQEWFEVYAAADVDLNGLVAGRDPAAAPGLTIEQPECLHLTAGDYAVFARSSDMAANGGLPEVTHTFSFSLVEDSILFIGIGDQVLDQITMTGVEEGRSSALDPDMLDPVANDDPASFALCNHPYGPADGGNTGTPGASNEDCGAVETATCNDNGVDRPIVSPAPGEIRITEAFANPVTTGEDDNQEWFEVRALADFDLNGLAFNEDDMDEAPFTIDDADCVPVETGDFVLFARNADTVANGGLTAVDELFDFTLNDSGGRLFVKLGERLLDVFMYGNAASGIARQLDPGGVTICGATVPYGSVQGQLGTPRAANSVCDSTP